MGLESLMPRVYLSSSSQCARARSHREVVAASSAASSSLLWPANVVAKSCAASWLPRYSHTWVRVRAWVWVRVRG